MTVPHSSASPGSALSRPGAPAPGWQPDEIGLPRAAALALSMVALLLGGLALLASHMPAPPPPPPVTVQLLDSASAMTVAAAPPPPIEAAAPPPFEAALPPPDAAPPLMPATLAPPLPELEPLSPAPSPIAVPTPSPALQQLRPARRAVRSPPLLHNAPREAAADPVRPAPSLPALPSPAAPAAAADVSSGLGPYRAALHRQIERNLLGDGTIERLGVSGAALIEATIAPDGRVLSARLARSSGIRPIDEAALGAMQRGDFPAFGPHMPAGPITVSVPIGVEAD